MKLRDLILPLSFFLFAISISAQPAQKINEFNNTSCDDLISRLLNLFEEAAKLKDSKVYILIYQGKLLRPLYNSENKTIYPRLNEVKAEIKNIKMEIKSYKFNKNQTFFVEGGFRDKFTVEFWIVPEGALPPKPSPTLKKMKYSKGRAEGSCKYI